MSAFANDGGAVASAFTKDGVTVETRTAVSESFTGSGFLEAHTGETGASWDVSALASLELVAGWARLASGVASAQAWPSGAIASPNMAVQVLRGNTTGSDDDLIAGEVLSFSIYVRWNRSTNSGYRLDVVGTANGGDDNLAAVYTLYRVDAGVAVSVATASGTLPGTIRAFRVECADTLITVRHNGTSVLTYTAPSVSEGDVAVGFGLADSHTGLVHGLYGLLTSFLAEYEAIVGVDSTFDQDGD